MNRYSFGFWIFVLCAIAVSGVIYGAIFYDDWSLIGAVFALFVCVPVIAFERGLLLPRLNAWVTSLSTPAYIIFSLLVFYLMVSVAFAACGGLLWSLGRLKAITWQEAVILPADILLYTIGVSLILSFVTRVRELLGRDVFASLLLGRYRKPIEEERVFLFIDLVGSTSFAEEFGDLRAQQFLSALFTAIAKPVRQYRGTIDDYVGDAAIITWPMARGLRQDNCVKCAFAIVDAIEADADKWLQKFGRVPRLRIALHGGPIVTAEVGVDHHKIAYFGDTVNTTARLEGLCRALGVPILISSDLAKRLDFSGDIKAEYLGQHALKGRGQSLGVMALTREKEPGLKLVARSA